MKKSDIDQIKEAAGKNAKEALEGRKKFLELRLRQDPEVRKIFIGAINRIAAELAKTDLSPSKRRELALLFRQIRQEVKKIKIDLNEKIEEYHISAVEAGGWFNRAVTVKLFEMADLPAISVEKLNQVYVKINREAVYAVQNRTVKGLKLSKRIWKTSKHVESTIVDIVQESIALGQDAVTTAKMLQQYVKSDALTLAENYPEMWKRLAGRVPKDLSYEALRLARTETTTAYGQGSIQSAQAAPSCIGIKYCLSSAHRLTDICDELARADEAGLGPGVYPVNDPPPYPAHPNTRSFLVPQHESPEDFIKRLKQWQKKPDSQPDIENWFQNDYSMK